MRRLVTLSAFAVAASLVWADGASAHAFPRKSQPPPGSTLQAAPTEIMLTFSEALEARFSTIEVHDAAGQRVDAGDAHAAADDPKRFGVALKTLAAGTYKVMWHATSVDMHRTDGSYEFTVGP